jgi:hypothetical protein
MDEAYINEEKSDLEEQENVMIHQDLAKLEAEGKPIRVGVSGAGWIGHSSPLAWNPMISLKQRRLVQQKTHCALASE